MKTLHVFPYGRTVFHLRWTWIGISNSTLAVSVFNCDFYYKFGYLFTSNTFLDIKQKFPGEDSSDKPCDEVYKGEAAFSEPESRAIRDFVLERRDKLKAFLTIHTWGQYWLVPYGNQKGLYPPNFNQ